MSQLVQTLYHQNPFNETQVPGIDLLGEDVQLGGGGVITGPVVEPLTGLSQFFRVNKTAGTSNFFANAYRGHNWLHPFLDPAETWPYIMRLECLCITEEVGASNRFYFGIVDFTTPATPTTIVGVGFYADTGGNWTAFIIDQTTSHLASASNVDANAGVHHLRIDIDGQSSKATFFIDGLQVATFTMPVNGLGEIGYSGASLAITQGVQGVLSDGSLFVAAGGSRNFLSFVSNEDDAPGAGWTPCDNCN